MPRQLCCAFGFEDRVLSMDYSLRMNTALCWYMLHGYNREKYDLKPYIFLGFDYGRLKSALGSHSALVYALGNLISSRTCQRCKSGQGVASFILAPVLWWKLSHHQGICCPLKYRAISGAWTPSGRGRKSLIKPRASHRRQDALCLARKAQHGAGGRIEPFCWLVIDIWSILLSSS